MIGFLILFLFLTFWVIGESVPQEKKSRKITQEIELSQETKSCLASYCLVHVICLFGCLEIKDWSKKKLNKLNWQQSVRG